MLKGMFGHFATGWTCQNLCPQGLLCGIGSIALAHGVEPSTSNAANNVLVISLRCLLMMPQGKLMLLDVH